VSVEVEADQDLKSVGTDVGQPSFRPSRILFLIFSEGGAESATRHPFEELKLRTKRLGKEGIGAEGGKRVQVTV
jgi:hypothetical protein